jgi:hypothetical protein
VAIRASPFTTTFRLPIGAPAARPVSVVLAARSRSIIGNENVDRTFRVPDVPE